MDCPLYIESVPKCDCGRDERETARPVALLLEATISDFTEPAEKDCSCECVPSLAFVQARVNAAAEFDALQPGKNEERPFDTAQFSLAVGVSGYHQHQVRQRKIASRRHLSDEALLVHIRAVYAENRGAYGWPRIWRKLRADGVRVGKRRVQRLMQQNAIRARGKRRFRIAATDSGHNLPVAANVLDRNFTASERNQAWVGDFTYIATEQGWLFLSVVIDLFSRKVIGWSMRPDMRCDLVVDALEMAWMGRSRNKTSRLLFHSDRGSQYASYEFSQLLQAHGITPSMSRKGNCWDTQFTICSNAGSI